MDGAQDSADIAVVPLPLRIAVDKRTFLDAVAQSRGAAACTVTAA